MRKEYSIAVVIPVHNRRDELIRALHSVRNQISQVNEVWVIDDCSDQTLFPISDFTDWDILKFQRLPIKSNANVARNLGASLSKSDYIAFLDSDDEWEEDYIENCRRLIQKTDKGLFSGAKILRSGAHNIKESKSWSNDSSAVNFLLSGGFAQTSSFVIERTAFSAIRFDEELKRHQDFDFFVRFSKQFEWRQLPFHKVIVHWEENRKVTRDAVSEMKFIHRFLNEIEPAILKRYLRMQYDYFFLNGQPDDYKLHQSLLPRIAGQLTFAEYKSFFKEKSKLYLNTIGVLHYTWLRLKA